MGKQAATATQYMLSDSHTTVLTDLWHTWLRRRRLVSENTIISYETALKRLERHAGYPRDALHLTNLEDYLRSDYSYSCKEQTFVAYRLWHRWGAIHGHWTLDPELVEMRLPKRRKGPQPALTDKQATHLLAAAGRASNGRGQSHGRGASMEMRLAYLGLYAGLRVSEIVAVGPDEWQGDVISVTVKGGWIHKIPVHRELARRREEVLSDWTSRRQTMQEACERMRLIVGQPMSPHWLRRTFAERLATLGVEREVIGAILGHSSQSITVSHYAPVTWTEMAQAIAKLHYGSPQLSLF